MTDEGRPTFKFSAMGDRLPTELICPFCGAKASSSVGMTADEGVAMIAGTDHKGNLYECQECGTAFLLDIAD